MKRKNIENTEIDLNENDDTTLTRITINTKKNGEEVAEDKKENRVLFWCLLIINVLLISYIIYQIVTIFVDGYAALS